MSDAPTEDVIVDSGYYGSEYTDGNMVMHEIPLRERLRQFYDPSDFVTVQNVDTRPVTYQYAHPDSIETYSAYAGHKDTVMKRPPQRVTVKPGALRLCPAYEADLMIETLIKQITSKRNADEISEGKAVPWSKAKWQDPTVQKELIGQIFIGKEDPMKMYNEGLNAAAAKAT